MWRAARSFRRTSRMHRWCNEKQRNGRIVVEEGECSAAAPFSTNASTSPTFAHYHHRRPIQDPLLSLSTTTTSTSTTDEEAAAVLFHTLKAVSMRIPRRLVAISMNRNDDGFVRAQANNSSWRNAAVFQGYRPNSASWGTNTHLSASSAALLEPEFEEEDESDDDELEEKTSTTFAKQQSLHDGEEDWDQKQKRPEESNQHQDNGNDNNKQQQELLDLRRRQEKAEAQLLYAIKNQGPGRAIQVFEEVTIRQNLELSLDAVVHLFKRLSYSHPFHAYQIMRYILHRTNTQLFDQPTDEIQYDHPDDNHSELEQQQHETRTNAVASRTAGSSLNHEQIGYLYRKMCFAVRQVDPVKDLHSEIRTLVGDLSSELKQLHPSIQKKCYPSLVVSLVSQRSAAVGRWAGHYYAKMSTMELKLPAEYFQHLLTCSKYNRMDNLPYHDVLYQAVLGGARPKPHVVLHVVDNMFPFSTNIKATFITLDSVLELQRQTQQMMEQQWEEVAEIEREMESMLESGDDTEHVEKRIHELNNQLEQMQPPHSYVLSMTTLEYMADAAARQNHVELMLLIWDALELFNLEASKGIYESTALCFAKNSNLFDSCFVVLNDMEEKGYTPSPAFIKSVATALRSERDSMERVDTLLHASLSGEAEAIRFTPALMNIAMCAYAWRGQVDTCMALLEKCREHGWSLDIDSFSYALEAVGKATKRLVDNKRLLIHPMKKQALLDSYVEATETILNQIEDARDDLGKPVELNKQFIRNYIEFLCLVGDVETANLVAIDFLGQEKRPEQLVDNKTVLRVAVAHAEKGDFELARRFAASCSESLPFIDTKIDRIQQMLEDQQQAMGESSAPDGLDAADHWNKPEHQ